MKKTSVLSLCALFLVLLLSSCSALNWGKAAKAGLDSEVDDPGWAARNVPGLGRLGRALPPPTKARKDWDRRHRESRRKGMSENSNFSL